jgi:hypothetical protein
MGLLVFRLRCHRWFRPRHRPGPSGAAQDLPEYLSDGRVNACAFVASPSDRVGLAPIPTKCDCLAIAILVCPAILLAHTARLRLCYGHWPENQVQGQLHSLTIGTCRQIWFKSDRVFQQNLKFLRPPNTHRPAESAKSLAFERAPGPSAFPGDP